MAGPIKPRTGGGSGSDTTAIHTNTAGEIEGLVDAVITASDYLVYEDADDANNKKRDTVQGILDLVPASPTEDLPSTLAAGNTTGGNDLEVTDGDAIKGQDAAALSNANGYDLWLRGGTGDGTGGEGALVSDLGYDSATWTLGKGAVALQQGGTATETAIGDYSAIAGGYGNRAAGASSFVGGGVSNYCTGAGSAESVIGGGHENEVTNSYAAVVSGAFNDVTGQYGFVGAGAFNLEAAYMGVIGGGESNIITLGANYATIAGGYDNTVGAAGLYGFIGGGHT